MIELDEYYKEALDDAYLEAVGAIIGWTAGKGEEQPKITPVLQEAYRLALGIAFKHGYNYGRRSRNEK